MLSLSYDTFLFTVLNFLVLIVLNFLRGLPVFSLINCSFVVSIYGSCCGKDTVLKCSCATSQMTPPIVALSHKLLAIFSHVLLHLDKAVLYLLKITARLRTSLLL